LDWKRAFELKRNEVVGLDIGSSEIKLLQLRKDGDGYAVTAAGIVDIAASEDSNSRKINTVRAIRKCIESTGTQARMAVCGVSGPEVAVRYFKFPALPQEEIEGAVMLEAAQVCPFNVEDATIDYELIPDGDGSVCGVLVATTNKLIETKRQLAKEACLDCVLMDVDGLALLNCFNGLDPGEHEKHEPGRTTAVLNVGSSYTTLGIMGGDALLFVRDMAYAGNDILAQVATENDVSTENVKRILSGCETRREPELELGDSLAQACQELIVDVTETLRYYMAQEKSAVVREMFVCGGFALVKGFVELLDSRLPARAVLWNPFDKIPCDAGRPCEDILSERGPAMAVAAGLAMRSI